MREARADVTNTLGELAAQGMLDSAPAAVARIEWVSSLEVAVAGAALVQESVPERLELKRAMLAELDRVAPAAAILASSCSTTSGRATRRSGVTCAAQRRGRTKRSRRSCAAGAISSTCNLSRREGSGGTGALPGCACRRAARTTNPPHEEERRVLQPDQARLALEPCQRKEPLAASHIMEDAAGSRRNRFLHD